MGLYILVYRNLVLIHIYPRDFRWLSDTRDDRVSSVPIAKQVFKVGGGPYLDSAIHVELFPAVFEWLTGSKYFEYKKNNLSARLRQGDEDIVDTLIDNAPIQQILSSLQRRGLNTTVSNREDVVGGYQASIHELLPDLVAVGAHEQGEKYLAHEAVERKLVIEGKEICLKMYSEGPGRGMLSLRGIKEGMNVFEPYKPAVIDVQAFKRSAVYQKVSE